jgi:hypothetical protein
MASEWTDLQGRLKRRLIRAVDVASILLFDLVFLLLGYLLTWIVEITTNEGDAILDLARNISHGTFLLLYLVWVVLDLVEFFRDEYQDTLGRSPEVRRHE